MEKRYVGTWWVHGDPRKAERGVLTIQEGSIRLELIGTLSDSAHPFRAEEGSPGPDIDGVTSNGKFIRLEQCLQIASTMTYSSRPRFDDVVPQTFYRPTNVHIAPNSVFLRNTDLVFQRLAVGFTYLPDWVQRLRVTSTVSPLESGEVRGVQANLEYVELPVLMVGETRIRLSQGFETGGDRYRTFSLSPKVWVWFERQEALSVEAWHRTWVGPFADFLTLMTGMVNRVTEVHGFHDANEEPLDPPINDRRSRPLAIEFVNGAIAKEAASDLTELNRSTAPYLLPSLEGALSETLSLWYAAHSEIPQVLALVFGVEREPDHYVSDQFLNLARALEIAHRARGANSFEPPDRYAERLATILAAVPDEHRPWLRDRLSHGNEPSFRVRVERFLTTLPDIESALPCSIETLAALISTNRNRLTHYSRASRARSLMGADLYRLSRVLLFVLKAWLLNELRLDPSRIALASESRFWSAELRSVLARRDIPD